MVAESYADTPVELKSSVPVSTTGLNKPERQADVKTIKKNKIRKRS